MVNPTENIIKFGKMIEINICGLYLWENVLDCLIKMSGMSMFFIKEIIFTKN